MKTEKILITQIEEHIKPEKKFLFNKKKKLKERKITKLLLSNDPNKETFNMLDKNQDLFKLKSYYINQITENNKELNILQHSKKEKQKMICDMDEKIQAETVFSSKLEISKLEEYYEKEIDLMKSKL